MNQEEWDPNDWQGRSRKKVDSNNRVAGIVMLIAFYFFLGIIIYSTFKSFFP